MFSGVQAPPSCVNRTLCLWHFFWNTVAWFCLCVNFETGSKFTTQRQTANLRVPYYVKADFSTTFKGSLRRLEQQVEEDHISNLKSNCLHEKSYSKCLVLTHFCQWSTWLFIFNNSSSVGYMHTRIRCRLVILITSSCIKPCPAPASYLILTVITYSQIFLDHPVVPTAHFHFRTRTFDRSSFLLSIGPCHCRRLWSLTFLIIRHIYGSRWPSFM